MEYVILRVRYDDVFSTPEDMAEALAELPGVESVQIDEAD